MPSNKVDTVSEQQQDKTALVTGGAMRIGAAIVKRLHHSGCRVLIHCHSSREQAESLAEALNHQRPDSALVVQGDLGSDQGIDAIGQQVSDVTDQLHLLVNNASRFYPTKVGETTLDQWKDLMGSNLRGPYFLTQKLLPQLQAAEGAVVNIVDIHAERPKPGFGVYNMAKAGLQMMTLSLARELGPKVRVNGVAPGAILWPEPEPEEEAKAAMLEKITLRRLGQTSDIADAVYFLGMQAGYVTGQILAVDGGRSLNI